ncbi:MAG TPA: type II secretion system F family protein [Baekduia sp.]|nr:type II secretion system F family protein [Baekduia sp.]
MSPAITAGLSGVLAVFAAWDVLTVLQRGAGSRALRLAQPLRAALGGGRAPTIAERRRLLTLAAGCLMAAGYLVGGAMIAIVITALAPLVVSQALRLARERWRGQLAAGAPAAARAIADALAGGRSITMALAEAAYGGSVAGATGRELALVAHAVEAGEEPMQTLDELARRASDPAWHAIVAAIGLQRRAGGDLAKLLRTVADVADERVRVEADARGLTAQARFTARIVAGMPLAGLVIGEIVLPHTLRSMLSEPLSAALVLAAAAVLVASLVAIGRISRLPV